MKKKVAIYLRVSTIGQSTELQRVDIEYFTDNLCNRSVNDSYEVCEWYEDKLTGTSSARPALRRMLNDARSGKINVIICWKLDRLFRSLKDLITTLQELNELGIAFISVKDQIDMTTASGRLLTHLLGAFAEFEASLIKERVIAGLNNAKMKGVRLGRPPRINASLVKTLRNQGMSLSEIAKSLQTTKGAVSKTLKKIHLQVIENTSSKTSKSEVSETKDLETDEQSNGGQL